MLTPTRFKQHCAQLVDPSLTPEKRKELIVEVRDSIELVHSQVYADFLDNFLPAFKLLLSSVTQPQDVDNAIHQTRAIVLEIISRLPANDVLRAKFLDVFLLAMDILQNDNEENAVTAIHIIFDLHKNYRSHLGEQVQPFLDFVRHLYHSFSNTVKALLLVQKAAEPSVNPAPRRMTKSTESFKVITECPLLVMFVFQLYPSFIKTNIQHLLPLMLKAIEVEIPPQAVVTAPKHTFHEFIAAQVKTVSFLAYLLKQFPDLMKSDEMSIPRSVVKLLQACPMDSINIRKELLVATRHILSSPFRQGFFGQIDLLLEPKILVGTGKGAANVLRPLAYSFLAELVHCVRLNLSVVQLEKIICIFSTNLHDPTFSYSLQTSAVRLLLNLIEGILKIDTNDAQRSAAARELLLRILETMVAKYVTLGEQVPRLLKSAGELREKRDPVLQGKRLCEIPVGDPLKEITDFKTLLKTLTLGLKTLIWSAFNIRVSHPGPAKPQNVVESQGPGSEKSGEGTQSNSTATGRPGARAGLLEKECEIVSGLLDAGKKCFRLYSQLEEANGPVSENTETERQENESKENVHGSSNSDRVDVQIPDLSYLSPAQKSVVASAQEEKEIFDQFAQIFTVLDIRSFQDIFGLRMEDLFDHIVENPASLTIPQHFLANSSISKYFADILLNFLVDKLSILDVAIPRSTLPLSREQKVAQSFLKLFKILFASVSLFPANEPVLRLHIGTIVRRCLHCATNAEDPHNYLQMLRALFKTLTSSKSENQFELLYRDFVPLVEPLFSGLLALYQGPNRHAHGELITELCLMIPARPSTIFPYLDLQIKPIVWALQGGKDNMQYGLRTLEFWVDMLQPGYLETLLESVEPDLIKSLYRLLRPPLSTNFGPNALRILGKLGTRARSKSNMTMPFEPKKYSDIAQEVRLTWPDGSEIMLTSDGLIELAADVLLERRLIDGTRASVEHKAHAWRFLYVCLSPFLYARIRNDQSTAHELDASMCNSVWSLSSANTEIQEGNQYQGKLPTAISKSLVETKEQVVKKILVALIGAAGSIELDEVFNDDLGTFQAIGNPKRGVCDLARYFAMLTVQDCGRRAGKDPAVAVPISSVTAQQQELRCLSHKVFFDAVTDAMSQEDRSFSNGGLRCFEAFVSALLQYCIVFDETVIPSTGQTGSKTPVDQASAGNQIPDKSGSAVPNSTAPDSARKSGNSTGQTSVGSTDNLESDRATDVNVKASDGDQKDTKIEDTERAGAHFGTRKGHLDNSKDEYVLATCLFEIVERLCHCCYQKRWNAKWAGAKGLGVIVCQIPAETFTLECFSSCHVQMIRALMFVVRELSEGGGDEVVDHGRKTLHELLRVCFSNRNNNDPSTKSLPAAKSKVFRDTSMRLTMDLLCDSANARQTARECFRTLGDTLGVDVADILIPLKEHLLRPLGQRPIRQQPFSVQVGYIEAIIFCLQAGKPVLSSELFSPPLHSAVLGEVIELSEDATIEKLTEAEEGFRHKLVENKLIKASVVKHLVKLRRKAVELLCTVTMHCPNFLQDSSNDTLFRKMISSFFKSLQSKDMRIVESAKLGLKQAFGKHPKPKELLQFNLRPFLVNLGDYKKLTIPYLQGLSRVLELFSDWFNVSLGDKLLEHLQWWIKPEELAQLKKWTPGTEARVGAAILDLFHLLPSVASKFLEKIVQMVIRLEGVLAVAGPGVAHLGLKSAKAASTSPYREPLLKYCNQHAAVAAKYFLMNLDEEVMRQIFFVMIRAKDSEPLRKELMDNPKKLVSSKFLSTEGIGTKSLHIITLIDLLSQHTPKWLGADPELMSKLLAYWRIVSSFPQLDQRSFSSLGKVSEVKTIAEIFIRYYKQYPKEINILFDLLPVFSTRTSCDFTFVKDFLQHSVTTPELRQSRRAVVVKFLSMFQDNTVSQEEKIRALQYVVTPMLRFHLEERSERQEQIQPRGKDFELQVVDKREVSKQSEEEHNSSAENDKLISEEKPENNIVFKSQGPQHSKITAQTGANESSSAVDTGLVANQNDHCKEGKEKGDEKDGNLQNASDPVLDGTIIQRIMVELLDQPDEALRNYDEPLSAELLRLATTLIQYMPVELGRYRKELIKFGWNRLKREDSIAKQWASVNVSRFFEAYQAPSKLILPVYVYLLRACQSDGKELIQQALDILIPALPRRLAHNPTEHKYPIWIRYTKKILMEEGHSIPNLVHIWQLITRHPDLFYAARAQFVPLMVSSLGKIGLNTSTTPENRRLALDIIDLLIKWERTRRSGGECSDDTIKDTADVDLSLNSSKKRHREDDGLNGSADVKGGTPMPPRGSSNEPPAKMRKNIDAEAVPVSSSLSQSGPLPGNRETEDFKPSGAMVDMFVNFMVQVPFRQMDRRESPLIVRRCVMLLKEALELWPYATIRLGFLEKLLLTLVNDKPAAGLQAANIGKTSGSSAPDASGNDSKNISKSEAQRIEKEEQAKSKRNAARVIALSTALTLSAVLAKTQGSKFVESNIGAIRALVKPAITEAAVQTSIQFASLLKEMLVVCPIPMNKQNESGPMVHSTDEKKFDDQVSQITSITNAESAKTLPGGNLEPSPKSLQQDSDGSVSSFYTLVNECVEGCIKSPEPELNQCGLIVLKAIENGAPEEIVKFQDMLVKSLHRMAKENLQASQQSAGGAGVSAVTVVNSGPGIRSGVTIDRNSSTSGAINTGRGSANGNTQTAVEPSNTHETGRSGKSQASEDTSLKKNGDIQTQTIILSLSILGNNLANLEAAQRKTVFTVLWALIDRSRQVEILSEVVKIVGKWVLWREDSDENSDKDPLTPREKVQFLLKMVVFERIGGKGSEDLMKAYLNIVLKVFGHGEKRQELWPKLERAFMIGMKANDSDTRQQFFKVFDSCVPRSLPLRLNYIISKQEWEFLGNVLWIKYAAKFLLVAVEKSLQLECADSNVLFPTLQREGKEVLQKLDVASVEGLAGGLGRKVAAEESLFIVDHCLATFLESQMRLDVGSFVETLQSLLYHDPEMAYLTWVELMPKVWTKLSSADKSSLEKAIPLLLTKEYHQVQTSWAINNIQALFNGFVKCEPLPALRADLVFHLGSRWRAWHTSLHYLEARENELQVKYEHAVSELDGKLCDRIAAEREEIADVQSELYRTLQERDFLCGLWKSRAKSPLTVRALTFEQIGQYLHAQGVYGSAMASQLATGDGSNMFNFARLSETNQLGKAETCFWEERWIECARKLCQWEVLTEFARVVVYPDLLHECLWRVPDWSALKELLIKNPVENGPQLKLYQAYVQLQENKLDHANNFIMQGYQRALEKYRALPYSSDLDAHGPVLVQFQQLVELQESSRILSELNALSRNGNGTTNVEQKIDNVRLILNTWRERLPLQHESLIVWNDILTWRNHVHAVVVNVLEALKEAANAKVAAAQNPTTSGNSSGRTPGGGFPAQSPQVQAAAVIAHALPQQVLVMGVNETAWNIHRFAKACRKQGYPTMALYALQKLYPFATMELNEYFVKTKETARSYMARPSGVDKSFEFGLHELNRCNMDHFNARQKAQLFAIRAKLCSGLGMEEEAVESLTVALSTSSDVGSAWLGWAMYCDKLQQTYSYRVDTTDRSGMPAASVSETHLNSVDVQTALTWRESAVNCYLQAARFGSRKSRLYFPRVLRLVTIDIETRLKLLQPAVLASSPASTRGENGDLLDELASIVQGHSLEQNVKGDARNSSAKRGTENILSGGAAKVLSALLPDMPVWLWLPWVPQLMLMLGRREASVARPILVRLAQQYPQAVFFPIRAYMEDRRQVDKPEKILSKEALKMSRPRTPAFFGPASPAQVHAVRQVQLAKENFSRAQLRYLAIHKAREQNEAAIAASQGSAEQAQHLAKKASLKEEHVQARRALELAMQEFKNAQQHQKQVNENMVGSQSITMSASELKKPVEGPHGTISGEMKSDRMHLSGQTDLEGSQEAQEGSLAKLETNDGPANKEGATENAAPGEGVLGRNGSGIRGTPFGHADFVMAQIVKLHQLLYIDMERVALELSFRMKPQREEHLLTLINALLHRCYQFSAKVGREVALSYKSALEDVSRMCFGTGIESREREQRLPTSVAELKAAFEAEMAPQTAKDFPTEIEAFIGRLRRWQSILQRRIDGMPNIQKLEHLSKHLVEMNESEVEVFGQYSDIEAVEPSIEKHIKITRFGADVRMVKRKCGASRGIEIIGSDGKKYDFILEANVNGAVQGTEDRTAQIFRMVNSVVFGKDSEAHRRRIQLTVPTFVTFGSRTRLVSDDPSFCSLADALEEHLEMRGQAFDDPVMAFRKLAFEALGRRRAAGGEQPSRTESIMARADAYHEICQRHVPDTCLADWLRSRMPCAMNEFVFRKRFAETLGAACFVSYSLAIGARRPQTIMFSWKTGAVYNVHMRGLISSRGVVESDEAVPFRLTRNMCRALGTFGLQGPFYGSMAASLQALSRNFDLLRILLDVAVRDELMLWGIGARVESGRSRMSSGSIDRTEGGQNGTELAGVESRVKVSVEAVVNRLRYKGEAENMDVEVGGNDVERNELGEFVEELIEKAIAPENLAQMEASWQAWY